MTTLKLITWLSVVIVTPWLVFMIISIFGGGEPFTKMGESIVSHVQNVTLKLTKKADMIKMEADELKEKITGKTTESKKAQEPASKSELKEKKKKKRDGAAVKQAPAKTDETQ
jgi:hypothetical protein